MAGGGVRVGYRLAWMWKSVLVRWGEGCSEGTDFHACIGGLELLWAQECAIKIDNDLSSRIVECLVQQ